MVCRWCFANENSNFEFKLICNMNYKNSCSDAFSFLKWYKMTTWIHIRIITIFTVRWWWFLLLFMNDIFSFFVTSPFHFVIIFFFFFLLLFFTLVTHIQMPYLIIWWKQISMLEHTYLLIYSMQYVEYICHCVNTRLLCRIGEIFIRNSNGAPYLNAELFKILFSVDLEVI